MKSEKQILIFILSWVILFNGITFIISITFDIKWIDVKTFPLTIILLGIIGCSLISAYIVDMWNDKSGE